MSSYKMQIDAIYSQDSIHKSLIICHNDKIFESLYNELAADEYPICDIREVISFKNDMKRVLMIDYIDFNNLNKLLNQCDIDKITTVFMIDYNAHSNKLPTINNSGTKYYIIQ